MKTKPTQAQHTPLPWEYGGAMNGTGLTIAHTVGLRGPDVIAINGGPGFVCHLPTKEVGANITGTETWANAEFIVRACNSHYELLQSLRRMVGIMDAEDRNPSVSLRACLPAARAAIAKATGEETP